MAEPVKAVCDKFKKAFELFGACHRGYSGMVMDEEAINQLGTHIVSNYTLTYLLSQLLSFVDLDIKRFMSYYRTNFPKESFPNASVLPKMHLLEAHMVDWLRRYHLGTGFMGEQGAESIHAHLNRLESTYGSMRNRLDRLKQIFTMYTVEVDPSLQTLKPEVMTRKRKRAE